MARLVRLKSSEGTGLRPPSGAYEDVTTTQDRTGNEDAGDDRRFARGGPAAYGDDGRRLRPCRCRLHEGLVGNMAVPEEMRQMQDTIEGIVQARRAELEQRKDEGKR